MAGESLESCSLDLGSLASSGSCSGEVVLPARFEKSVARGDKSCWGFRLVPSASVLVQGLGVASVLSGELSGVGKVTI